MNDRNQQPGVPFQREVAEILRLADEAERTAPMGGHPAREGLDRELREIKAGILRIGALVEGAIRGSVDALVRHDAAAAEAVITGDRTVNELHREVSSLIGATIATQAPVARDLRYLMGLDRVTSELERIGDHAGSVAKQARKLAPHPPLAAAATLPAMGELAAGLVHDILRTIVDADAAGARAVAARDDEIDDLYHATFANVLEAMRADPANVDSGARVLFAAHYVERIGDRVTNIAEDVVFLSTGRVEDLNP